MAELTAKEKAKVVEAAEKKVVTSEKAKASAEKRSLELEVKLGETELKLAEAAILNIVQAKELADLKAILEVCKNKWYEVYVDAKNSTEPVIQEARKLAFREDWLAMLQVLRVPEDSPLRDPNQILFPGPPLTAQNPPSAANEEETRSMRELVEAINSHVELVDLEATSNRRAGDQPGEDVQLQPPSATRQPPEDIAHL